MTTPTEDDAAGTARPAGRPARDLEAPDHLDTATDPGLPSASRRRGPRWLVPLLTALLGVALGLGLGLGWGRWWQPQPTVINTTTLVATAAWPTAKGGATVEVTPQGEHYLSVHVSTPSPHDGYRQLWLVTQDGDGRYPLGAMVRDERRFPLPPGLDLEAYPTVEMTYQVIDGKAEYSGDVMLSGQLG